MLIQATQKNTRQTPRKVRLVANAVKDLPLAQAVAQLGVMHRRASGVVLKVLRQAVANAESNHSLSIDQLRIHSIVVNEGPRFRRFRAVSRGRGHGIIKRTSHVTVTLTTEAEKSTEKKQVATKSEKTVVSKDVSEKAPKKAASKKTKTAEKKTTKPKSKKLPKKS